MSDPLPGVAVALVYETRERSEHVRDTLAALGTSIVYEAAAHELDRAALEQSRASVVIVNLDAQDEADLDNVYSLLDDERYRVVFNDGEVSSALSGWDHARWVRHLATKILDGADIDPPRPADAQAIAAPVAPTSAATGDATAASAMPDAFETTAHHAASMSDDTLPAHADAIDSLDFEYLLHAPVPTPPPDVAPTTAATRDAPATPSGAFDAFDIQQFGDLDLDFEAAPTAPPIAKAPVADAVAFDVPDFSIADETPVASAAEASAAATESLDFDLDDALDFSSHVAPPPSAASPAPAAEPVAGSAAPAPASFEWSLEDVIAEPAALPPAAPAAQAKDSGAPVPAAAEPVAVSAAPTPAPFEWSLEDVIDEPAALPPAAPVAPVAQATDFGIEKVRAEEFLAPVAASESSSALGSLSTLSLELMPLEEAVAPSAIESSTHENWLDPSAVRAPKIRRVWVLGASIGGPEAVREFLAALPRDYPALFVLAQHLGEEFVDMMARQLGQATTLPVRVPSHGERAGHGEVLIAPNSQRLLVDAQGVVVLERDTTATPFNPSIDRILRDVADRFGAQAGAIVFSGMSTDALEGCRHVVAKGGTVYAQRQDTCVVSTMIDGVAEAGLVSFFGSPQELAQKLVADSA